MVDSSDSPSQLQSDASSTLLNGDARSSCAADPHESKAITDAKRQTSEQTDKQAQEVGVVSSLLKSGTYVKTTHFGVYEMLEEVHPWSASIPGWQAWEGVKEFVEDWPFILRFFKECLALGPEMIVVWVSFNIIMAVMPAISLYLSGQLMGVIQHFIEHGAKDQTEFYKAAGSVLLWCLMESLINTYYEKSVQGPLKRRLDAHFNEYILRINIRLDLPTFQDPIVKAKVAQLEPKHTRGQAWSVFSGLVNVLSAGVGISSELWVLLSLLRGEENGGLFVSLAAVRPVLAIFNLGGRWPHVFYIYVKNQVYHRVKRLNRLASSDTYRKHIVADGLQDYIEKEHKNSWKLLGHIRTDHPWDLIADATAASSVFAGVLSRASGEMPQILFALQAMRNNKALPLKSLTLLSNSAASVGWRVDRLVYELKQLGGFNKTLRTLYEAIEIVNQIKDGDISYPGPTSTELGMKVEFKSVSFTYPKKESPALQAMSFTIQPGQLCVIVGENGCGKSSTVNLLGRLFDATDGEILVDDMPISKFKTKELRLAQAMLYQDFVKYPTSVRDNIGFGNIDAVDDMKRIRNAAEAGGALEFIEKLPGGFDSKIEATYATWSSLSRAKEDGPLQTQVKSLEEKLEISGGQWQRLAISRSFMRVLNNDRVRLMCYDEPSSALDPKAEFELFEKLRKNRGKKTLIFITHRFGHLTKHADVILYMKDGRIVEQGTHAELLESGGAYAHLYNVQAQAFN